MDESEIDRFLAAVAANPDEDTPRLVFADWLQEHGRDAHAEFVRLQCEMARWPAGAPEQDALGPRLSELWEELHPGWQPEFAAVGLPNVRCDQFARGFLDPPELYHHRRSAHPFAWNLLRTAATIYATDDSSEDDQDDMAEDDQVDLANPNLWRCVHLFGERNGLQCKDLAPFATAGHFSRLEMLDLGRNQIGPVGVDSLVRCPSFRRLSSIRLDTNPIGDTGAARLASAAWLRRFDVVDLSDCGISDNGLRALLRGVDPNRLTNLLFEGNQITDTGLAAVAAVKWGAQLKTLDFRANPVTRGGVAALVRAVPADTFVDVDAGLHPEEEE